MNQPDGWAAELIRAATAIPSRPNLTNFYLPACDAGNTFSTTAAERLGNLRAHLTEVAAGDLILVGEAAGWRGARQSGIAFTDAEHLGLTGTRERSARTMHDTLHDTGIAADTLLWNALPLHPNRLGRARSNRTPTREELVLGRNALEVAVRGRAIVCVGLTAAHAVSRLLGIVAPRFDDAVPGGRAVTVRHPSYGGAKLFAAQVAAVVGSGLVRPPAVSTRD